MIGDNEKTSRSSDDVCCGCGMCVVLKIVVYAYHLALAFLVFAPYEHTKIHSFRNILV